MKTRLPLLSLLLLIAALSGCAGPNFSRLIPENKDANIYFVHPFYGTFLIQTRVNPEGSNFLPLLSTNIPAISFTQ